MAIPLALLLRQVVGSAIRGVVDSRAGVKTAPAAVKTAARKEIRTARTLSGRAAASAAKKELSQEATEKGLSGTSRKKYYADHKAKVAAARETAKENYDEVLKGANDSVNLPRRMSKEIDEALSRGDLKGAEEAVRRSVSRAVTREMGDLRTGRRSGYGLNVDITSRDSVINEAIRNISTGDNLASAAREALTGSLSIDTKSGTLHGAAARQVANAAGEFNKLLDRARNVTSLPPQAANQVMSQFFSKNDQGDYVDDAGNVWSQTDLQDIAVEESSPVTVESIRSPDPMDSIDRARRGLQRRVEAHSSRVQSFQTSLTSSGMAEQSPRLFADVMSRINSLSPGSLASVIRTGVIGNSVSYFSSNNFAIVANMRGLVSAVGLDPADYSYDEMNW